MELLRIKSIEHLDELLAKGNREFVIASGALRSSKYITTNGSGRYYVLHYIDGSEEDLDVEGLEESNIGSAIRNGNFYCERV